MKSPIVLLEKNDIVESFQMHESSSVSKIQKNIVYKPIRLLCFNIPDCIPISTVRRNILKVVGNGHHYVACERMRNKKIHDCMPVKINMYSQETACQLVSKQYLLRNFPYFRNALIESCFSDIRNDNNHRLPELQHPLGTKSHATKIANQNIISMTTFDHDDQIGLPQQSHNSCNNLSSSTHIMNPRTRMFFRVPQTEPWNHLNTFH